MRRVASGRKFISPEVSEALATALSGGGSDQPHEKLTAREFQVFRMIAAGMRLSAIAQAMALSPKTVSVYRSRVLVKLGLANNVEIARYAIQQGFSGDTGAVSPDEAQDLP